MQLAAAISHLKAEEKYLQKKKGGKWDRWAAWSPSRGPTNQQPYKSRDSKCLQIFKAMLCQCLESAAQRVFKMLHYTLMMLSHASFPKDAI